MAQRLTVWTNERKGHHGEYAEFLGELSGLELVVRRSLRDKVLSLGNSERLIILDFEYSDWVLFGLIWIWSIFRQVQILSVHGELYERGRGWRAWVMRSLLRCRHRGLKAVSIHTRTKKLTRYFDEFVVDPQLVDVNFLARQPLLECSVRFLADEDPRPAIVVLGSWGSRREYGDLLSFFQEHNKLNFTVIARNAPEIDLKNVTVMRRYLTRAELFQIYINYDFFLFKYSNAAPSGFLGRAVQFGKHIIIPRGSYLDDYYCSDVVSKSYLDEMGSLNFLQSKGSLATDFQALRQLKNALQL